MGLLDYFSGNEHLVFADARTSKKYTLSALLHEIPGLNADGRKQLAFLYMDDSPESLSQYLSFLKTAHIIALLNNGLGTDFKQNLETIYHPDIIVDKGRSRIPGYDTSMAACAFGNYPVFHKAAADREFHPACRVLLSTSGSTGSPKFVKLSEENLIQNALSITDYLPINSSDVTPLNLPITYSYGLSVLHSNAIRGGTLVCGVSDIIQREFWTECETFGFTSIAGVPFVYEMLDRIGFRKKTYPSLRYMTQAGGNLNAKTKLNFVAYSRENKIEFYVMYGQTEATARISFVPPYMLEDKLTSIGIPIRNGVLDLDPDNSELLYSGPNVFGGYANDPEDLCGWDPDSWLRTGDLGEKDGDGYFYITGRMKRFVKLYGNRINLDELERYLKIASGTNSIATNGIGDKMLLVSYSGEKLEEDMLKKNIFDTFKIHPASIKFQKLEEIPLTGNGKVNYKMLGEAYGI